MLRSKSSYRPALEALESRYAPAASIGLDGTTLLIGGDNGNNNVVIEHSGVGNTFAVTADGQYEFFFDEQITKISVNLKNGNDTFSYRNIDINRITRSLDLNVNLGSGNDLVDLKVANVDEGVSVRIGLTAEGANIASSKAHAQLPNRNTVNANFGAVKGLLSLYANLGAGDDTIHATSASVVGTGKAYFNFIGNEAISVPAERTSVVVDGVDTYSLDVDGTVDATALLSVNMFGGAGRDNLSFDYEGNMGGALELSLNGGSDGDTLGADVHFLGTSSGVAHVMFQGRSGDDALRLDADRQEAGAMQGYAVLDCGDGANDTATAIGTDALPAVWVDAETHLFVN